MFYLIFARNLREPTLINTLKKSVGRRLSKIDHLPFLKRFTPPLNIVPDESEMALRVKSQNIAFTCAETVAAEIKPGWTEKKTAKLIRLWLSDHGIRDYFHLPLVFFGERTRYNGLRKFSDHRATGKVLQENDVYILDFGPVIDGVACDVSVTKKVGDVEGFDNIYAVLMNVREKLPALIREEGYNAGAVWNKVQIEIRRQGFEPLNQTSEYSFFGHRLNGTTGFPLAKKLAGEGKQILYEFVARGLSGQLWTQHHQGSLLGIWAVEPHIGTKTYGVKFEEMLLVSPTQVRWLKPSQIIDASKG